MCVSLSVCVCLYSQLAPDYFRALKAPPASARGSLNLKDILRIAASVFKVPSERIHAETSMSDLAEWNSLNHIVFITGIQKEAGLRFRPVEIARATSIRAILDLVNLRSKVAA